MSLVGKRTASSLSSAFIPWRQFASRESSFEATTANSHDDNHSSKLWILGSGSMGLFLASAIRSCHTHHPLSLLLRDHHEGNLIRSKISPTETKDGLGKTYINISLEQPSLDRQISVPVPATLLQDLHLEPPGIIRTLVLTTKAFQAIPALQSIRSQLAPDARIVVLCNGGLAVRDELERAFENNHWQIELASITHGAYLKRNSTSNTTTTTTTTPYQVVHAGIGQIYLVDNTSNNFNDIANDAFSPSMLNQAGLNCQVLESQQMESVLWYKLAANCVCNPLTAIHQCTNGALKDGIIPQGLDKIMAEVIQEICQVQHAIAESSIADNDKSDGPLLRLEPHKVAHFIHQVIDDNLENRSSMQQDVQHQRPTEIEFLNGYIARAGVQHGIDCPSNRHLQEQIWELEAKYPNPSSLASLAQ